MKKAARLLRKALPVAKFLYANRKYEIAAALGFVAFVRDLIQAAGA